MDLRQLAALVAVADTGTFSAAADALHTVQSNVSAHVARLEKELGTPLVDRAAGRLTEEGDAVVARARRIQAELEAMVADVAALTSDVEGTARLGMIGTTARWLVPLLLSELDARHPGVHLVVVEATSTSLEPRLVSGSLDLAVVNLPVPSHDVVAESLFDEDLLLVVPDGHPFAAQAEVRMADLGAVELLLPPKGTAFRDELDVAAAEAGVTLRAQAELDGVRLIASLAIEGHGLAVLPATALPRTFEGPWTTLPVLGLPPRQVGLALRRRGLLAAPARAVMIVLHDVVAASIKGSEHLARPGEGRAA